VLEAWRIAVEYMTPVMLLTDGYIANGSEPWPIPKAAELPRVEVKHPGPLLNGNGHANGNGSADDPDGYGEKSKFLPYLRDAKLARPWAVPGTVGLEHRIGGLEKQDITGNVNYEAENHQHMVNTRAKKVADIAENIPLQEVKGPTSGDLLVISWGGTYGACATAVDRAQAAGKSVAHAHLRYLNPFPKNLGDLLRSYKKVLVPELNMRQLNLLLRGKYLVDCIGYNKVQGKPFSVGELVSKIYDLVG
jgi:2-oxoglutarate/2-oxoacid ferredoxin oxidoreductase subunit alpha